MFTVLLPMISTHKHKKTLFFKLVAKSSNAGANWHIFSYSINTKHKVQFHQLMNIDERLVKFKLGELRTRFSHRIGDILCLLFCFIT
jgi:hypothetical protein